MRVAKKLVKSVVPDIAFDAVAAANAFKGVHGRLPNILYPRTFNEKVIWRSLFDRRPILKQFSDKYAVRPFVEKRLGSGIMPIWHFVTEDPEAIPFENMPDRFVVKPTHGSGWVKVVRRKSELDIPALVAQCKHWLSQDYYQLWRERVYKDLPRRIIIEEFIDDGTEGGPSDYKFFVFDGKVEIIQAILGRHSSYRIYHLDREWQRINIDYGQFPGEAPRPHHFDEMVGMAETLGKGIDFVRVDLYDTPEKVYFGELTTTPSAGQDPFPRSFDEYLGSLWR